jgi:hypothetical protein
VATGYVRALRADLDHAGAAAVTGGSAEPRG